MAAALPPVTDCGCDSVDTSSTTTGSCCPLSGVNDPNLDGIVPSDTTLRFSYYQLADLVNGPVVQVWYWNPSLLVWQ